MDSTSDPENKIGRGTTILSYIRDHIIYIVSDGRRSSTTQGIFLVLQGNDKKIYKITDNICATTAGSVSLCEEMLEIAREECQSSEDIHKLGTKLKKHKQKYLIQKRKESEKNKKKPNGRPFFEAQFGLHSVDRRNGGPFIQVIAFVDKDAHEDEDTMSFGTGGDAAKAHFIRRMEDRYPKTPHEVLSYMKLSVVESLFGDIHTGGFIQDAILSPDGLIIGEDNDHIIKHLADNHQQFIDILKTKLLCITMKFAYEVGNEEKVTELISQKFSAFPRVVPKELLLGVHQKLIVRCVNFRDEATANRAFDSLGKQPNAPVKLSSGKYGVEFRRPTRDEFVRLAGEFVDENDL